MQKNIEFFVLQPTFFYIKNCSNSFFLSFKISSHVIADSSSIRIANYSPFFTTTCIKIRNITFTHKHQHLSLFHLWFQLHFLPSNLHLHLPVISFIKIFNSFFPVNLIKTCIFNSYVLFGTHTLLDKSLRV